VNRRILSMASAISRSALTASSKGKHGLTIGSPANRFLEGVGGGKINLHAKQLLQSVFKLDHVDQGEPAPRLEFGDQVDVGIRGRFFPCDRAMEAKVDDPGCTELGPMRPERFKDLEPLHPSTVPHHEWADNPAPSAAQSRSDRVPERSGDRTSR